MRYPALALAALFPVQLALAQPAFAAPTSRPVEVAFTLAPSELDSYASLRALLDRLRRFARAQCDSGSHYTAMAEYQCRHAIETQLVRRIGDARLARLAGLSPG